MIIGISQPTFIPWYGYFGLIEYVDEFIFLDHVQFDRRSWQQRNYIKIKNEKKLLTIPTIKENRDNQKILDVKIDHNSNFTSSLLKPSSTVIINRNFIMIIQKKFLIFFLKKKKNYLNIDEFMKAGIELKFFHLNDFKYSQLGTKFIPKLSIMDLVFNEGPKSSEYIKANFSFEK